MALNNFKSLVQNIHSLLDDIQNEVIATIDTRNPAQVSPEQAGHSSEILVSTYRKFAQLSDVLATYAVDPSDHVTSIAGSFHESNALRVVSELRVADALGRQVLPMAELAINVKADVVPLRKCSCIITQPLMLIVHLGQCMRMLVNRGIFRETEFGSDVFANNRMSSILLSSHENNLHGFIGHWYDMLLNLVSPTTAEYIFQVSGCISRRVFHCASRTSRQWR